MSFNGPSWQELERISREREERRKDKMSGAFGIPTSTTLELVGKTQEEIIDHLYSELDRCADGNIDNARTLLISLTAATLVGLPNEQVAEQLTRITNLLKLNVKVILEPVAPALQSEGEKA